jgi:hypothetical protein
MTFALLNKKTGRCLAAPTGRNKGQQTMQYNEGPPGGKSDLAHVDDDRDFDWVVGAIARRCGLSTSHAKVVCTLAHIGRDDGCAPAAGGRTK